MKILEETLKRDEIDINDTTRMGATILHRYVQASDMSTLDPTEVMDALLRAGVDINAAENGIGERRTALHVAVLKGSFNVCKALLCYGPSVDAQDKYGNTPLWRAVMEYATTEVMTYTKTKVEKKEERGKIIELLLDHKSDPNKKNNAGISSLELARTLQGTDVVKYFSHYPSCDE